MLPSCSPSSSASPTVSLFFLDVHYVHDIDYVELEPVAAPSSSSSSTPATTVVRSPSPSSPSTSRQVEHPIVFVLQVPMSLMQVMPLSSSGSSMKTVAVIMFPFRTISSGAQ